MKETNMSNPVKNLECIKCHSLNSPTKLIKSPRNSIIYNSQKICSLSRRPQTILEIRKKATFFEMIRSESKSHTNNTNENKEKCCLLVSIVCYICTIVKVDGTNIFRNLNLSAIIHIILTL